VHVTYSGEWMEVKNNSGICAKPAAQIAARNALAMGAMPMQLHLPSTYKGVIKTQLSSKPYCFMVRKEDSNKPTKHLY